MINTYLISVLGIEPLFNPPPLTKEPCPFCLLYPEFDCPLCKEENNE